MAGSLEIESNKVSNKNKQNAWEMIQSHFNLLNHIMISIVAVYMTFLCYYAGNKPVSWHAWLCTIGVSDFNQSKNFDLIFRSEY